MSPRDEYEQLVESIIGPRLAQMTRAEIKTALARMEWILAKRRLQCNPTRAKRTAVRRRKRTT